MHLQFRCFVIKDKNKIYATVDASKTSAKYQKLFWIVFLSQEQ